MRLNQINYKRTEPIVEIPACQCSDMQCPTHPLMNRCANVGNQRLYRIDMADDSGTQMCVQCADDAYESGLFSDTRWNDRRASDESEAQS